mgnify:CR=1 FL=1|tara:strand:+ start:784 stop:1482 length:699 start_codon:yes stop_codon:yes gene_type:complete
MIKIYCDTSNLKQIKNCIKKYNIDGVTTNPSIMKNEGVKNYKSHCLKILKIVRNKPLSVEVFADNQLEIYDQAKKISKWGRNIFVKIPIINTRGKRLTNLISKLNQESIKLNITAVFSLSQIRSIKKAIKNKKSPVIISIFCGRISDSGIDAEPIILNAKKIFKSYKNVKILWASVRETFNYNQALRTKTDIITVPPKFIKKIKEKKLTLENYSKITVKQFFLDGKKSNFKI